MLSINLDSTRSHWHPGDSISGEVRVMPQSQISVEKITVSLEGLIRTLLVVEGGNNSQHRFKGQVTLFKQDIELLKGPYTIGKEQQWPIRLQLPHDCTDAQVPPYKLSPSEKGRFSPGLQQVLPPTASIEHQTVTRRGKSSFYIEYLVTAKINRSGFKLPTIVKKSIQVKPYRPESYYTRVPSIQSCLNNIQTSSLHLNPTIGDRRLTISERIGSVISPRSLPSANHELKLEYPDIVDANGLISLTLHAKMVGEADHMQSSIELRKVSVVLVSHFSQVVQSGGIEGKAWAELSEYVHKHELGSWEGRQAIQSRLDLPKLFSHGLVMPPSIDIKTFIVTRWHTLKVRIVVECARKQHRIKFHDLGRPLEILPVCHAPLEAGEFEAPPYYE